MKFVYPVIFAVMFLSCSKKSNDPNGQNGLPGLITSSVQQERDNVATTNFQFTVSLDNISSKDITFQYSTVDGTAKSNVDYTPSSGTLTIPANQNNVSFNIPVIGDSLREPSKNFYVQLSNPVNASVGLTAKGTGTILCDGTYLPVDTAGYSTPISYPGYTLAWSDEFNESSLDSTSWNYETGAGGWGNNELENYTNSIKNCFITNGKYLVLEARSESVGGNNYTSARIQTMGKREFKYGRIDIRAKLPTGQGMWPALWMLGGNIGSISWPACGELDMMEVLGNTPAKTYGTIHWGAIGTGGTQLGGNYTLPVDDFSEKFHVFTTIWTADTISWYVDDVKYFTADKSAVTGDNPFNQPFFFIFNIAVGGNWPGSPDGTTVFPQRMIVDYVRVFQ
jgi:beta-glucanase (GH16 family)